MGIALSEEIAHPTVYHHLSQLSVYIQLNKLIKCKEDSGFQMQLTQVTFPSLSLISPESAALRQQTPVISTEMLADSTALEQVISCSSVSCLINTAPLELLRLQLSEPIASESVV